MKANYNTEATYDSENNAECSTLRQGFWRKTAQGMNIQVLKYQIDFSHAWKPQKCFGDLKLFTCIMNAANFQSIMILSEIKKTKNVQSTRNTILLKFTTKS